MTPHQQAAECRARIESRRAYDMDIGGVRSKDEREIVLRIIEAEQRRAKPRLKLVRRTA